MRSKDVCLEVDDRRVCPGGQQIKECAFGAGSKLVAVRVITKHRPSCLSARPQRFISAAALWQSARVNSLS
jgi:hypothetical protein